MTIAAEASNGSGRQPYDVRKIVDQIRRPRPDIQLVAAHRGLRWNGVAENSKAAIAAAADHGLACIEVDIRMTSDGHVVLWHDDGLGRASNIAEVLKLDADDVYSPFTGQGYNPFIKDVPWVGGIESLSLKEEHGLVVDEGILTLEQMLQFIRDEEIDIVVLLDVKDKAAIPGVSKLLCEARNAVGISALEWCIFKIDVAFYSDAQQLELEPWFREARIIHTPLYIPVYEPESVCKCGVDEMESIRSFSTRPYVISFEIGLRSPGGQLQNLLNLARSLHDGGCSIGYFGALGDLHPQDTTPVHYEPGEFDMNWKLEKRASRSCFYENRPPMRYDDLLAPGEAPDWHDHRGDLAQFRAMGYSWVIADMGRAVVADLEARGLRQMQFLLRERL